MAEVTSGNDLTVVVLNTTEAAALAWLLRSHPTGLRDFPMLTDLYEGLMTR